MRSPTDDGGPPRLVSACYWFDPGTYREKETTRELWYVAREASPYRVRVRHHTHTGAWEGRSSIGATLWLASAEGPDFDRVIIQGTVASRPG